MIILFVLVGCNLQTDLGDTLVTQPAKTSIATESKISNNAIQNAPVAIVSLESQRLEFYCMDGSSCLPTVDLGQLNLEESYELDSVFYWDQSNVYVMLYAMRSTTPFKRMIIHINPQTGETKFTEVPESLNYNPYSIASAVANGRLVLANQYEDTFYILDSDLSITKVAMGTGVEGMSSRHEGLIEANDREVIAYNKIPVEKDGTNLLEVAVIDVASGKFTYQLLDFAIFERSGPQTTMQPGKKYLFDIVGLSPDLKQVSVRYRSDDAHLQLGTFDLQSGTEVVSTGDSKFTAFTSEYSQYLNFLYSSHYPCDGCAGHPALLINMPTLISLLDSQVVDVVTTAGKKFTVTPFGDFFLLDKADEIVLLSLNGETVKTYSLPKTWIDRNYQVVQYRR